MKQVKLKSLRDLSEIKNLVASSSQNEAMENVSVEPKKVLQRKDYKHLTEGDRGKWAAVFDLLLDPFFSELAEGKTNKISSKRYSVVVAALTYPTRADSIIDQDDLDRAHGIAYLIKMGVNSGSIKYTNARIPSTWRIAGNPGTRR
jgi:hypothetical protein